MLSTARVYDRINRLVSITSTPSVSAAVGTTYGFNGANQRVLATESSGENWNYSYDTLGQVTGATKKTSGASAIAGHQFGYQFDTIGNRTGTARGDQASSYVLRTNNLNQYASRQVPGKQEIVGSADVAAAVLVNERPASRQGTVFSAGLEVDNTTSPVWKPVSIVASLGSGEVVREAGDLFIAKTPEEFTYDADGNMTGDGRWTYTWDAENRLTLMETKTAAWQAGAPRQRMEFGYDSQARRVFKKVYVWGAGSFALATSKVYVYDNWNMIAELDALDANAPTRNYAWGLDVSGGFAGAGGVGGLLVIATNGVTYAPTYDGNGNVTGLVDFADGKQKATYAYGPFGEVTMRHGSAALENQVLFSTKFTDKESGLVYYGLRYYFPSSGRWLSNDPIGEFGGVNVSNFISNDAVNSVDLLGLMQIGGHLYSTYIIASIVGRQDAHELAIYSAMPDALLDTTAYAVGKPLTRAVANQMSYNLADRDFHRIQQQLHSLVGGLAQNRRDCLRKLLQKEGELKAWQRGFLVHAFGDSYFHSYTSRDPYALTKSTLLNIHLKGEVLWQAPIGHGLEGTKPDSIVMRKELFAKYANDLAVTLNGGPLDLAKSEAMYKFLKTVNGFPEVYPREAGFLRALANSRYQYGDGYDPKDGLPTKEYMDTVGAQYGVAPPSAAELQKFLALIRDACCIR